MQLLLAVVYVAFISLGLPDSLLGAAWPSIYPQIEVPVSYAGIISMLIAAGTIVSSLNSDRLTLRFWHRQGDSNERRDDRCCPSRFLLLNVIP